MHNNSFLQTIKSKAALLVLGVAIISLCSATVFDRANFSGDWKLNEQKSDLGQFGARMAVRQMKIVQTADSINLDATAPSQQGGEVTRKEKLTFDGKENENVLSPQAKKKSTAKWSEDGQTLTVSSVILFDRNGEQMEIKVTDVWKLGDNGQTLTQQSNSSSSFGENSMKLVYEKAK